MTFKNKPGNKIILAGNNHNIEAFPFKTHLVDKQKLSVLKPYKVMAWYTS